MKNEYLLKDIGTEYAGIIKNELLNLSLDELFHEYELICLAEEKMIEADLMIENVGWVRHESENYRRERVYSTLAEDLFGKEFYYNRRANARKNTRIVLEDQKKLLEEIAYEKSNWAYEVMKKFCDIQDKYRKMVDQFFEEVYKKVS